MMDDRRGFLNRLGAAALAGGAIRARAAGASAATSTPRNLRFGHWLTVDSPHHAFVVRFAELVARKTAGALTISVYPNEQLGTYAQQLDAQRAGTLDFSLPTSAILARIDPKLLILTLPYLFASSANAYAVLDGAMGRRFMRDLPAGGVRVLVWSTNGIRNVTNSKHPIEHLGDLRGLRIRVPPNGLSVALFRALGAEPVVIPFTHVYAALRDHRADGQENPFVNIYTGRFFEVQRYCSLTRHQFEGLAIAISEHTWTTFDTPTRAAVASAAREAAAGHRIAFDRVDVAARAKMATAGLQIVAPDLAPFRARSRSLYRELATVFGADLVRDVERAARG